MSTISQSDLVVTLLQEMRDGDADAANRLLPIVYKELRRLAAHYLRGERSGQTIQATELVHEAYLRLVGHDRIQWHGQTHFFALAAMSMRRILVDRARKKKAERHGGGGQRIELEEGIAIGPLISIEMIALDHALVKLASIAPRQSRVVELRFFGGLEFEEIAGVEGISVRSVKRDWSFARAWIHRELSRSN
jgi:RNA polymerase sigma factor (TIGR02999 family)